MNLHELQSRPGARKARMRVGRGMSSGKGKTCGRGHKGQYARSGHKHKPGFEGGQMRLARRLPKRGFHHERHLAMAVVNVGDLGKFPAGTEVSAAVLREAGLLRARDAAVKVLGRGALAHPLRVKAAAFSASAKAKIEAAGGVCEIAAATGAV